MSCSIVTTSGVSFGAYEARKTTAVESTGLVAFECRGVASGDMIMIQLGRDTAGSFVPRRMHHGAAKLEYNLYLDAARTRVWGDGTAGTNAYSVHPSNGRTTSVPIFGQIPARQDVAPGHYHDQVLLTVLY